MTRPSARHARPAPASDGAARLALDPSVCDGIGMCAHLAPELITVDSWGYPIVSGEPLDRGSHLRQARAAVLACPRRALMLAQ